MLYSFSIEFFFSLSNYEKVPTLNIPGVARSFLDRVCSSFVWESKTTSRKSKKQIKNYV